MIDRNICPECGAELDDETSGQPCAACLMRIGLDSWTSRPDRGSADTGQSSDITFDPPAAAELSRQLPNLDVLELLGQGGMGAVYKARQIKLDRPVALKIIRPESADDAAFSERFNREARTLARLSHPNIVSVHDFGEVQAPVPAGADKGDHNPLYYFVMEYVDGTNLRQVIQSGNLQAGQALPIIAQICEALQFAHDEGIVHRDIKPENILIDSKGRVKIADFGLAKLAEQSARNFTLTGTHQVMGTPRYMAPEQMEGSRTVDHRADLYSLGVVIYELLTGELPMGQFEPPSKKVSVNALLDDVVMRALAREPERRFQSASELKSSVNAISSLDDAPTPGHGEKSASGNSAGASTIIEREAMATWRWIAGERTSSETDSRPESPVVLMLLLSVMGCLTVLLPWMDVEIQTEGNQATESIVGTGIPVSLLCGFQDEISVSPSDFGYAESTGGRVIRQRQFTVYGFDHWPGITVCVAFALLALLLIALPARHRRKVRWFILMTVLAGLALLHTVLFKAEVNSTIVQIPDVPTQAVPVSWSTDDFPEARPGQTGAKFAVFQESDQAVLPARLSDVEHQLTLRPGYFGSLGLSIVLLVLSASGIRHAAAGGMDPQSQQAARGLTLATVRFQTHRTGSMTERIRFFILGLGYEVVRESADELVYRRGRTLAGLASTDIRGIETTLTVRTSQGTARDVWVSCVWNVRTMGAVVGRREIAFLEAEGQELQSFLSDHHGPATPAGSAGPGGDPPAAAYELMDHHVEPPVVSPLSPIPVSRGRSASTIEAEFSPEEVQMTVAGPSVALLTFGVLGALGCVIAFFVQWIDAPSDFDDVWYLLVAGAVLGSLMALGGWSMRNLQSRGIAVTGAIMALLPSPAMLFTLPFGIWALRVLHQHDVRQGFLWKARRHQVAKAQAVPRFSRKAIVGACLSPLFFIEAAVVTLPVTVVQSGPVEADTNMKPDRAATAVWATVFLALPGLLAPLATTILGFIAISQIRRSDGRLVGLGLAFFDTILFPFLFFDILIFGACWFALQDSHAPRDMVAMFLLITTAILGIVNAAAGWWLWERVCGNASAS